jgi:hypothetical protein
MMKVPAQAAGTSSSAALAIPSVVVLLVLMLGATIYLRQARYIRRRTSYLIMAVLLIALLGLGAFMYRHPN